MKEVRFYLPTVQKTGEQCSLWDALRAESYIVDAMSQWYGGVTMTEGQGIWLDDTGKQHKERVFIMSSYASPEAEVEHHEKLVSLALRVKELLNQECILVSVKEVEEVMFL